MTPPYFSHLLDLLEIQMTSSAHVWCQMSVNRVHEFYRCIKAREEFMAKARIAHKLLGPAAARGWVSGARNHNRWAIEAKRDSRRYLEYVKGG